MDPLTSNVSSDSPRWNEGTARVLAVTSGKGGVGKTNICANLAIALTRFGRRVCVFDADIGLANINIITGRRPLFTLEHFLSGEKALEDILITGPGGITIVPGAAGVAELGHLNAEKTEALLTAIEELEQRYDYILIDTSSGISESVTAFVLSAPETLLVITPEPTSLTDSYNLMKVLKERGYEGKIYAVTNLVQNREDSLAIFNQFNKALSRYLELNADLLGRVVLDRSIVASVIEQNPVTLTKPQARASLCFNALAEALESTYGLLGTGRFSRYWKQVVSANREGAPSVRDGMRTGTRPGRTGIEGESLENLVAAVVKRVTREEADEQDSRKAVRALEEAFTNRFKRSAVDPKTLLYDVLNQEEVSEAGLMELSFVIDSAFEKRFHKPIRDVEDMFLKLLEDRGSSETRLEWLFETLNSAFRKRYQRSVYNLRKLLSNDLKSDLLDETEFKKFVHIVREAYRDRFGKDMSEPLLFTVDEMIESIDHLKDQEAAVDELMERVLKIKKERLKLERRLSIALHGRKVP
ncbi:MAG: MinD/ParA family protein [Thermodesulfobacteriota bacterium]